jgi:hypothetical protein
MDNFNSSDAKLLEAVLQKWKMAIQLLDRQYKRILSWYMSEDSKARL